MSVYAFKNSRCKTFRKTAEIPGKVCNLYSDQVFPFEFSKIFINSRFSEHIHGVAFAMICCLQNEQTGKKKVFGRSSFAVLITVFSIVSLINTSITINV